MRTGSKTARFLKGELGKLRTSLTARNTKELNARVRETNLGLKSKRRGKLKKQQGMHERWGEGEVTEKNKA